MKTILLAAIAILSAPPSMAGQAWKPIGPNITAALEVDAQGHVTRAQLVGEKVLPQLETLAEQTTRNWRFVPATVGGNPASARTYATLAAETRKVDGNQQVRLRYVSHGPGILFLPKPYFPRKMMASWTEASVMVGATVEANGTLSDVRVIAAKTTDGAPGQAFYDIAIRSVAGELVLPELVNGHPVATHMRIPYTFCLMDEGCATTEKFREASDAPRNTVDDDTSGRTTFADAPIALDSPLKIATIGP
jgi:hypothetical protein